jgi:hypothetical protein
MCSRTQAQQHSEAPSATYIHRCWLTSKLWMQADHLRAAIHRTTLRPIVLIPTRRRWVYQIRLWTFQVGLHLPLGPSHSIRTITILNLDPNRWHLHPSRCFPLAPLRPWRVEYSRWISQRVMARWRMLMMVAGGQVSWISSECSSFRTVS